MMGDGGIKGHGIKGVKGWVVRVKGWWSPGMERSRGWWGSRVVE